jgi:hypothetical protein
MARIAAKNGQHSSSATQNSGLAALDVFAVAYFLVRGLLARLGAGKFSASLRCGGDP